MRTVAEVGAEVRQTVRTPGVQATGASPEPTIARPRKPAVERPIRIDEPAITSRPSPGTPSGREVS